MSKEIDSIIVKKKDVPYRIIESQAVIVNQNKENKLMYHTINEIGTEIWELIDGKRTIKEIIEEIIKKYEIEPESAQKDIIDFIQELKEKDLVEVIE
jgi:hypothetical protein